MIKIDLFGLTVDLNEKINADDEFAINIAGPVFNLFLCLLCVALYWLVPHSYSFLKPFCCANLMLALFNLLPIYPLDGSKLLKTIIKDEKIYIKVDKIIRYLIATIFFGLFLVSIFVKINVFLLLVAIFFLFSKNKPSPSLSIFKYTKPKDIEKVVLLKITKDTNLFNIIKLIKRHRYTIFYYKNEKNNYIDQDTVIDYATKYPLTTTIREIC